MLVGGQALKTIGIPLLPAGVAAVSAPTAPIFLALFAELFLREPLGLQQVDGVAQGFARVALMA